MDKPSNEFKAGRADRLVMIILLSLCALGAILALGWH
jgi:hypothetical protein